MSFNNWQFFNNTLMANSWNWNFYISLFGNASQNLLHVLLAVHMTFLDGTFLLLNGMSKKKVENHCFCVSFSGEEWENVNKVWREPTKKQCFKHRFCETPRFRQFFNGLPELDKYSAILNAQVSSNVNSCFKQKVLRLKIGQKSL